jgi:recombination protein RecA
VQREVPFVRGVLRGLAPNEAAGAWGLAVFAGRLCEVSGNRAGASLTFAFRLVHEAQRRGELVAWVAARESAFFPPDVAEAGIDLDALAVVRVGGTIAAARATEHLLRSGAFGAVVIDLGPELRLPLHVQTRLAGLAKKHGAAAVCITEKDTDRPSLGSLVSLRVHTARAGGEGDRFRCEVHALKDKRGGPGWRHAELCRGPDGLR